MVKGLKLAISPCPNDTYIFGGWVSGLSGSSVELPVHPHYLDIQQLNDASSTGLFDIIKISAAHWHRVRPSYQILNTGAALGDDCGPLLISRKYSEPPSNNNWDVVLPGLETTASYLFQFAFPEIKNKQALLFSAIEQALVDGLYDTGVIIHESRFNYAQKGLHLLCDLGTYWSTKTGCPIPLGLIAVRRSLPEKLKMEIRASIEDSIAFADNHLDQIWSYIRSHAAEMDEEVIMKHIRLYVNSYSKSLGTRGIEALQQLYELQTGQKFDAGKDII